jgi:hypothetical protein
MKVSSLGFLKKIALFCFVLSPLFSQAGVPDWIPLSNPAYNMDVTANLSYLDGTISINGNDLVAGFVGEECRGVASPLDFLDGVIFLTLGSQQASGETIIFKAYLADLDSIVDLNETVSFENMTSVGTLEEPFLFTIDENIPPFYYEITASSSSNGSIDPEGIISVESGTDQSFLIVADDYHHIEEVLIDGSSIGTPDAYTFYNIEASHTIHANFAIDTYTLVYLAGSHGSLSGNVDQEVAHGSDGTAVTAIPDAGYTFASWSDGSTANPRTDLNVTANIEVTANFGQNLFSITSSASENGTIAPAGEITVAEGSSQNFQISPSTGYHIDDVLVDGSSVGIPASYTFENITSNHTIYAAFAINSYTLTYLAGDGGSLSGNTVQTIQYGGSGSAVLAVADAGYQFESWSDGSVANPRTDDNITEDLTVTANFTSMTGLPDWEPIPNLQYQMNVIAKVEVETGVFTGNANDILGAFSGTECRGIANPVGDVFFLSVASNLTSGETISFKAYLADQDSIVSLNETVQFANMAEIGTFGDPFILTIDDNLPPLFYTISASAGTHGNISPEGDVIVEEFTNQAFDITADAFYHIEDVTVDGNSVGIVSEYTFNAVESDHSIHATFAIDTYTLTYLAGEHGSINGEAIQIVDHGSDGVAVTAVPDAGYTFASWSDGSTANPRVDQDVTADLSVTANFGQDLYTIEATSGANGSISPEGDIIVAEGSDQSFTITANEGYHIDDVTVDAVSVGAVSSYTFENILSDHSIHADFEINSYTLIYEAGNGGSLQGETVQTIDHGGNGTAVLAVPDTGFAFDGWSDGNTDNPRIDENVTSSQTLTANFSPTTGVPDWSPEPNLQYNMQVLAKLQIDETTFASNENDIVAAFVEGECRGLTHPLQGDGTLFLTVGSNQSSGETVTFKAYLSESDEVVNLNETITFQNMGEVGDIGNPFIFTIDDGTPPAVYSIEATSGANGTISPTGIIEVIEGSSQTFEILADFGYMIASVAIDGIDIGAVNSYEFTNIVADHTIHASFVLASTHTLTYISGNNGSLEGELIQEVPHGGDGTAVLAIADETYQFDQWSDGSTVNPRIDENVQLDITVTAHFEPIPEIPDWYPPENMQYNMSVVCKVQLEDGSFADGEEDLLAAFYNGQCRGIASPIAGMDGMFFLTISSNQSVGEVMYFKVYFHGQSSIVDLNETISFTNLGEVGDLENPFIFTIAPDVTTFEITATAGDNGSIDPVGVIEVEEGSDQLFNFIPDEGYHINDVIVDGISVGNPANYNFENVNENHSISVNFAINTFTISASAGANGNITPIGDQVVDYGSDLSFVITPDEGYQIAEVLVDGNSLGGISSYTFENITEDHSISVSFTPITYSITASAGENGSIDPAGLIEVDYGNSQSFSFYPDEGYHIEDVIVDGVSVGNPTDFSFDNIITDHTISVSFAINTYTITASAGENGTIEPLPEGGMESFDNWENSGSSYVNGSFTGNDGSTWTCVQARGDISITGTAITLGRNRTPQATVSSGEIAGGIGVLNFDYMQAFSTNVNLNVLVNGIVVANVTSDAEQNLIKQSGPIEINIAESFVIQFISNNNSDGQVTIDNISWTAFGAGIIVEHGSDQTFNFIPDENYHVDDVIVDGESIGNTNSYTFENVIADHTIHADFAINTHELSLIAANNNGSVSGAGVYNHGTLVSINASAYEDYAFVNWTENEQIVSVEADYSFTISSDRELVANFVCTPDWTLENNYAYTMQVVAQLSIDGEISVNPNDKIGAFVGEECRGIGSPSVDNDGLVFLSVASDLESGEVVKLRIWQSSICSELIGYPEFIFDSQALLGSADEPYIIKNGLEQSLVFNQGYTWFSANVNPSSMQPSDLFIGLNPCNNDRIIGQSEFALYYDGWVGSLTNIDPKKMYRMKLCEDQTVVLTGEAVTIEPIELSSGYSWVGFSPQECIPINEATINITPPPSPNDRITGQNRFALFTGTEWVGTITALCPGEGYVFRMAQASTILYPETASTKTTIVDAPIIDFDEVVIKHNKAHTMMVVGELAKEGQLSQSEEDRVFAYINGECVGGAAPMLTHNNKFFLNIGSDVESGESVTFKVWLAEYQRLYDVNESLVFQTLGEAGNYNNPMLLHLKELVGVENKAEQQVYVGNPYPNPFTISTTIPYTLYKEKNVTLKLIDSQGKLVYIIENGVQGSGEHNFIIQNEKLKPGIYTVLIHFSHLNEFYQVVKPLILK